MYTNNIIFLFAKDFFSILIFMADMAFLKSNIDDFYNNRSHENELFHLCFGLGILYKKPLANFLGHPLCF